jgi:gliding motility-associated-like protein
LSGLHAQAPILNLSFDDCDAVNLGPNSPDGEIIGSPTCECGVFGNSFRFSGNGDAIEIADTSAFNLLTFSITFYFQPDRQSGDYVMLSHREECNSLHGFTMNYLADNHQIDIELSRDIGRRVLLTVDLPENKCWYHIVFERSGGRHSLFVDGVKLGEVNSGGLIDFFNPAPIVIGGGPCVPDSRASLSGLIDEFRIYDRILNAQEKFNLRREVNQIASRDTVILLDSEVNVRVTDDCTESYTWSPVSGVEDVFVGNTTLRPMESQVYVLEFNEFNCTTTDSISIIVVDPDEVTCDDLSLPSAFSPNADGLNDRFFISNPFLIEELLSFEIFDRSGATVFHTANISDGWDGYFRGEPVNPGVFLYKVQFRCGGEVLIKSGQVMVMR